MQKTLPLLLLIPLLAFFSPAPLHAADSQSAAVTSNTTPPAQYKVISGFKQPFNDDLQSYLSQGWKPVGGVSVTTWNNDLYFAQLLIKSGNSSN